MQKLKPETFAKLLIATENLDECATLDDRVAYVLRELDVHQKYTARSSETFSRLSKELEQAQARNQNFRTEILQAQKAFSEKAANYQAQITAPAFSDDSPLALNDDL